MLINQIGILSKDKKVRSTSWKGLYTGSDKLHEHSILVSILISSSIVFKDVHMSILYMWNIINKEMLLLYAYMLMIIFLPIIMLKWFLSSERLLLVILNWRILVWCLTFLVWKFIRWIVKYSFDRSNMLVIL